MIDNIPKGSNEQRIRTLERQVADLMAKLRGGLMKSLAMGQVRLARCVSTDTVTQISEVKWIMPWRDGEEATLDLLDRSAESQGKVSSVNDIPPPADDEIAFATMISGNWYWFSQSSPTKVAYAQAPPGGLPPRIQSNRPSKTECEVLAFAPVSNAPYFQAGDLLATGVFIDVQNWTDSVAGAEGSRLIQVDNHIDGESQLIGWICNDTGDPSVFDPWDSFSDPWGSNPSSPSGSTSTPSGSGPVPETCRCELVFQGGVWIIRCKGLCPSTLPSISNPSPPL